MQARQFRPFGRRVWLDRIKPRHAVAKGGSCRERTRSGRHSRKFAQARGALRRSSPPLASKVACRSQALRKTSAQKPHELRRERLAPRCTRYLAPMPGEYTNLPADKPSVLKKTRILDDRQPFLPSADPFHQRAPVGQRSRRCPEIGYQGNLEISDGRLRSDVRSVCGCRIRPARPRQASPSRNRQRPRLIFSRAATRRSIASGVSRSSASRYWMNSPRAKAVPRLRAALAPRLGPNSAITRSPYERIRSAVPSVEPSSMTMISVCG